MTFLDPGTRSRLHNRRKIYNFNNIIQIINQFNSGPYLVWSRNPTVGWLIDESSAVVWQSKIFKLNSCDPVKAMNQARKQLWPFFGRISTLRSVFKMVQLVHTETFPWVSHLYYVLRQPPSHNLLENPGKSLKRERLHKKLNDYKLDFEVMKQENSHFTFLIFFWI